LLPFLLIIRKSIDVSTAVEQTPAISVIMAAHNAAATISEAIHSALSQSLSNFELLVVDDASTDATAAVVGQIADPRLRLISSTEQLGAAGARQRGAAQARAPWLNFLDADDRLKPNALCALLDNTREDTVVSYGSYTRINQAGNPQGLRRYWPRATRPDGHVLRAFLRQNRIVNGGAALIYRAALEEVGGWPQHLRTAEDWALWVLLATRGPFRHTPEVVLEYRQLPTGLSQSLATTLERKQLAIDWVYTHPRVQQLLEPPELTRLRGHTEGQALCLLACQQIRRQQWQAGLAGLMRACQRSPGQSARYLAQALLAGSEA
jgi:glycosyltransferase involved in cell wall biosynthesis